MINTIEFWRVMTYIAAVVSIVGPSIALIAGVLSAKHIFGFGGEKEG